MTVKYGPVYYAATIPKGAYPGLEEDVPVAAVANLLIVNEAMDEKIASRYTCRYLRSQGGTGGRP